MRSGRLLATLAVATTVGTAGATVAVAATPPTPRPQIHDRSGDWVVPSQDIRSGIVTADAHRITAHLSLSAAPATGVRTVYAVVLYVGCAPYVLEYDWNGVATTSSAQLKSYSCGSSPADAALDQPAATYRATAQPSGDGVTFTTRPAGTLRPGKRVSAVGITEIGPTFVIDGFGDQPSQGGDIAYGRTFVLGR